MLFVKKGIKKIQIPPSMRKVDPSRYNTDTWVVVVAKGTFPTNENHNFGKYLDPDYKPCESFLNGRQKELSDMYKFLMIGVGIPENMVKDYVLKSKDTIDRIYS